jgi:hypothetical protein
LVYSTIFFSLAPWQGTWQALKLVTLCVTGPVGLVLLHSDNSDCVVLKGWFEVREAATTTTTITTTNNFVYLQRKNEARPDHLANSSMLDSQMH